MPTPRFAIAALMLAAVAASANAQPGPEAAVARDNPARPPEAPATQPNTPLPEAQRFHGVAVQLPSGEFLEQFKGAIREVADTGADTVRLSLAAYQENASSSTVALDPRRSPSREQLVELIKLAKSLKLRVIVSPIVLLADPRGSEWRGRIVPEEPDRWWADYRRYIDWCAKACTAGGADVLMVGGELNKLEPSVDRWRDLIAFLRKGYPVLRLSYTANWDRYWKVEFWDALDYAGVTSYYTLSDHEEPTVEELVEVWKGHGRPGGHRDRLVAWQKRIGRPVIFAEVGWYSRKGTATRPWDYYYNIGHPSELEQANLYRAFLLVWKDEPMVGGIIFWEWTLGDGGPSDEGYTPNRKAAEQVMREYFKARAHPGAALPPAGGLPPAPAAPPAARPENGP